jgi:ABC-type dipeptide/oligopeptide/nickel transport system permease component
MSGFIVRRLLAGLATLVVASFLVFLLVAASGKPLAPLYSNPQLYPATIAAAGRQLHLTSRCSNSTDLADRHPARRLRSARPKASRWARA